MNKLNIRNAQIEDVDKLYKIEMACFPLAEAASKKAMEERIRVFAKGFLVGEINGKIIGFINGAATSKEHIEDEFFASMSYHEDDGKTLMIYGLDVHPDYQRNGYAEALMNAFIESGINDKREKVILTCKDQLVRYYEKFGYISEGKSDSEHGGVVWYDMFKKL